MSLQKYICVKRRAAASRQERQEWKVSDSNTTYYGSEYGKVEKYWLKDED